MKLVKLVMTVFAGCGVAACSDLAVYENDAATVDGGTADGGARDSATSDSAADNMTTDDGHDVAPDDAVDGGTDSGAQDAGQDGGAEDAVDTATCPPDTLACSVGGPCVHAGYTDSLCGVCPGHACGTGFSCMSPSMNSLDQQCCHNVDQTRDCSSQCQSPAGCLQLPSGMTFCCENN